MASTGRSVRPYALATAGVAITAAVALVVEHYAHLEDLAMIHLLGIVLLSLRFSVRVSLYACALSILAFDFLFIPPRFAFAWTDARSSLIFVAMIVVAAVISGLNERLRKEEHAARAAAFRAQSLYELGVELSTAGDARQLVAVTARYLETLLSGRLTILLGSPEAWAVARLEPTDRELAERAWLRHEFTRRDGPEGSSIWTPVIGVHVPHGVMGLSVHHGFEKHSQHGLLLAACANQLASAMDRVRLATVVRRTELEAESERLRSSLLSAVSHDLKTPLTTIIAAGTTLMNRPAELDHDAQRDLLSTIVNEGERLSRLIQNLLSISRLESPTIELRRTPEAIEEIVSAAVDRFGLSNPSPKVSVTLDPELPLVVAEPLLLEQVLANLLENAARYAGTNPHIAVHVGASNGSVVVQVSDDGPGIPVDERDKVFEKFYRGRRAGKADGGVGLGLTICRAIIRAHGGRITVQERSGGGALFEFNLPAAPVGTAATESSHAMAS